MILLVACASDPVDDLAAEILTAPATALAVARIEGAPELPPLRPGELVARPAEGEGLRVLGIAPEGEELDPSQVAVVFDRPMVALSALETPVPVSCTPAIAGRARWAGTSTAVIVPEGNAFPAATSYDCTVPAGTAALDGTALAEAVTWSFATPRPALERTWPRDGASDVALDEPIRIRFNQAVDPARVAEVLSLRPDTAVRVFRPAGAHNRPDTVEVRATLAVDTAYTVHLAPGLLGAEGRHPAMTASSFSFRTYARPAIVARGPEGPGADPEAPIRLEFATEVEGKEVNDHLAITPKPPDGWKPAQSYTSRWWSYAPRLAPRTTYTMTLSPGVTDTHGQTLAAGATWTFTTGDLRPRLDVPWGKTEVYPATNPSTLPIRHRNVPHVDLAVERIDPVALVTSGEDWYAWERPGSAATIRLPGGDQPNAMTTSTVDLAPYLSGGRGLLRVHATAPGVEDWDGRTRVHASLIHVTDLGANLKLTPDGATVWVTRLSDASPVQGATVHLVARGKIVWTGTTDGEGLAVPPARVTPPDWNQWWNDEVVAVVAHQGDTALVSHAWNDGLGAWEFGVSEQMLDSVGEVQVEGYSDRGVYKLGDVAHVAFVARERGRHELRLPGERSAAWTLYDPAGQERATGTGRLDDGGGLAVDLTLPGEGALGDYAVELKVGGATGRVDLPVRAYRAPAFRVDVTAPERLAAGTTLGAIINGRYLFGAPMASGSVRWSVRRSPLPFDWSDWSAFRFEAIPSDDPWSMGEAVEESVASGTGELNAQGQFGVATAVPTSAVARPWRYTVEGTVTDVDRQVVSGRTTVDVHSAEAYPGVRAREWMGFVGKPVGVELIVADPDGKPTREASLTLTALRRTWDAVRERGMDGNYHWVNTAKDEVVSTAAVKAAGTLQPWEFTPQQPGLHVVRVASKDRAGRAAVAEAEVYVLGGDVAWAMDDARKVPLVPDKPRYAPGETAHILVKAPRPNMRALVTVEREGIFRRNVVALESTADTVEVEITDEMMPNAFVSVVLVQGAPPADRPGIDPPAIGYGLVELAVDAGSRLADVKLTTDKPSYRPRETVRIHLESRPGAFVTLWAVDYGVLSLTAYETPDLHQRFYAPRPLSVLTADNRLTIWDRAARLAKGAEAGGGGGYEGTRTRIETTPYWAADLRTDARGILDTTAQLPDNLTTFRLMAVVRDAAGAFGKAEHEIRVSRPLIARPALPRFLRAEDRALAGIVVHNNTEGALDVDVAASARNATLKGAPRKVKVAAGGAVEVPFAITGAAGPTATFEFSAKGADYKDGVIVVLPVTATRVTDVVATAGSTTTTATEQVAPPPGAKADAGGLTVDVSASALVGMGSAVDYLVDYPYGCIEQVSSRLRVALLAERLRERAGLTTPPEKLKDVVTTGLAALQAFRVEGGGMSYWPGDRRASGTAGAYALEVLTEAKRAGYTVEDAWLDDLAEATRRHAGGGDWPEWMDEATRWTAASSLAAQLARAGHGDPATNSRTWDRRALLPNYARAQLMEAIVRTTGADARTAALQRELDAAVHVEATSAALRDQEGARFLSLWYGEDLGTSAYVRALSARREESPLLPRLAAHLVAARRSGRWANTYTTANALAALADYVDRYERGEVAADVRFGEASILRKALGAGGSGSVSLPMSAVRPGPLRFTAAGGGRLYYEARLAYAQGESPPRDEGFTLSRTLAVLEGTGSGGSVSPGALVRVTLRVVTPVDRYNVAIFDPLPAGLEPVDTTFATTAGDLAADTGGGRDTAAGEDPGWFSTWVFNRRELRDDAVVLFADRMPAGIHVQSWLARATTPGDYAHPAARVEEMYRPEVYGRTEEGRFVVGRALAKR